MHDNEPHPVHIHESRYSDGQVHLEENCYFPVGHVDLLEHVGEEGVSIAEQDVQLEQHSAAEESEEYNY